MKKFVFFLFVLVAALFAGCASWLPQSGAKQTASVVDYLYPNTKEPLQIQPEFVALRPPVRVGVAFVPGGTEATSLPEAEKLKLLERVRAAFAKLPYIGSIEVIPTSYLQAKGGFTNLEQVARMFNVEVVALLSYDQVQFNDTNSLAVLYWTIVGAYIIHGDQYDVQTLLDASVFDVRSHKLLFRAPGTSQVKGTASMAGFSEKSREAQLLGYNQALDNLIPNLQNELERFRGRIKAQPAQFKVEDKPGYHGGGALGYLGLLLALGLGLLAHGRRPPR